MQAWGRIQNTLFSSQLTNGSCKLECYITPGWKGLPAIMSEIGFLPHPVLFERTGRDFLTIPVPYHLILFHKKLPFMIKITEITGTDL